MSWQDKLKDNITTVEQLKQYIKLDGEECRKIARIIEKHPMSITPYYMSLIKDRISFNHDPIKRMIVPQLSEFNLEGSYDTSGEAQNTKLSGVQHKYQQTALILATNRCAAYCRHCFRKRLVGLRSEEIVRRVDVAVAYIKDHKEIDNVLITGGDPFVLSTDILNTFIEKLMPLTHIRFIRFGTKTPVTFPARITEDPALLNMLKANSLKDKRIYIVTQFNHPNEITAQSTEAVDKLLGSGTVVNNQTVLLKGVNDDAAVLAELQSSLVGIGVNPYYVFHCRPVKRVKALFQMPLYTGYNIVEEARKRLNGHSKRFKYVMSHRTGKIEIVGIKGARFIFKYHQARDPRNLGRIFFRKVDRKAGWLDDLKA
jgi:lysine 2,3-aminomutase